MSGLIDIVKSIKTPFNFFTPLEVKFREITKRNLFLKVSIFEKK